MRQIKKAEVFFNSAVLLGSILLIIFSSKLVTENPVIEVPYLTPKDIPILSLGMIGLGCAWCLFRAFVLERTSKGPDESQVMWGKPQLRVMSTVIIMVLGWLAIQVVGLLACCGLLTATLLMLFGMRDWKKILFLSGVMVLFTYVFFEIGLKIWLPRGILFSA